MHTGSRGPQHHPEPRVARRRAPAGAAQVAGATLGALLLKWTLPPQLDGDLFATRGSITGTNYWSVRGPPHVPRVVKLCTRYNVVMIAFYDIRGSITGTNYWSLRGPPHVPRVVHLYTRYNVVMIACYDILRYGSSLPCILLYTHPCSMRSDALAPASTPAFPPPPLLLAHCLQVAMLEFTCTFVLLYVVFATAIDAKGGQSQPLPSSPALARFARSLASCISSYPPLPLKSRRKPTHGVTALHRWPFLCTYPAHDMLFHTFICTLSHDMYPACIFSVYAREWVSRPLT